MKKDYVNVVLFCCYFCLLLNIIDHKSDKKRAVVMPVAVPFKPPEITPMSPFASTASFTPFASEYPNPVRGTVAPADAKSAIGA